MKMFGRLVIDETRPGTATVAVPIPLLGSRCRFAFLGVEEDAALGSKMLPAVERFLQAEPSRLLDAEPYVFAYCRDMLQSYDDEERPIELPAVPHDVWSHVRFGDEIVVRARFAGDAEDGVYLSLDCDCSWEEEHGLMLVFRDGATIVKVGPSDGHVTQADAFADGDLVGVVYWSPRG